MTPEATRAGSSTAVSWREGERRVVTALFADVRGLAKYAVKVPPKEAVATFNTIYAILHDVITSRQGIVNRFHGDGMLAIFGAPLPLADHASAAARASLDARVRLERLAATEAAEGRDPLRVGFSLNTGTVTAGCLGSADDAQYTVVGRAIDIAARLVRTAAPGEILLGAGSATSLKPELQVADRGIVDLVGIGPTPVFELLDPRRERHGIASSGEPRVP